MVGIVVSPWGRSGGTTRSTNFSKEMRASPRAFFFYIMINQKLLHELFFYEKETGHLIRKTTTSNTSKKGQIAGWMSDKGYVNIGIKDKTYPRCKLVWCYVKGNYPDNTIDHINRKRDDDRIENLRECTFEQNLQNKSFYKNNTTGYKGVIKRGKRFGAQITISGKCNFLGYFDTAEEAHKCYLEKA